MNLSLLRSLFLHMTLSYCLGTFHFSWKDRHPFVFCVEQVKCSTLLQLSFSFLNLCNNVFILPPWWRTVFPDSWPKGWLVLFFVCFCTLKHERLSYSLPTFLMANLLVPSPRAPCVRHVISALWLLGCSLCLWVV